MPNKARIPHYLRRQVYRWTRPPKEKTVKAPYVPLASDPPAPDPVHTMREAAARLRVALDLLHSAKSRLQWSRVDEAEKEIEAARKLLKAVGK